MKDEQSTEFEPKPFEDYAEDIFENFNFETVHAVMVFTKWNWDFGEDSQGNRCLGIPDLRTIKTNALRILKMAYNERRTISTGGFEAGWMNGYMFLKFTLEEWGTNV